MRAWSNLADITRPQRKSFLADMKAPENTQWHVLHRIITENADTAFGQEHGFATIQSVDAFRRQIPVAQYDGFRSRIIAMTDGKRNVLTFEDPLAYDLTSGSTGAAKTIPYTTSNLASFRRALLAWFADVLETYPKITQGRFYWALSPAARETQVLPGGATLGPINDAVFFGEEAIAALSTLSVVPPDLALETDVDTWRTKTLFHLLAAQDLTFISIWSPTFLTALLDHFARYPDTVLGMLHDGTADVPANPQRAQFIKQMLENGGLDGSAIWPDLELISTWADASAGRFVPNLKKMFPQAAIQGKGLMSTEAMISIPVSGAQYPVLALGSAFFEFMDDGGELWLAHEIMPDHQYRVIVTTPGGLYRYDTTDVVRIHEPFMGAPTLEFVGRSGEISDMCGEKLSGQTVTEALDPLACFAFLAPMAEQQLHYALLMDAQAISQTQAATEALRVDRYLCANPHYEHARNIGQLAPVAALRIDDLASRWSMLSGGNKIAESTAKPPVLSLREDWPSILSKWGVKE